MNKGFENCFVFWMKMVLITKGQEVVLSLPIFRMCELLQVILETDWRSVSGPGPWGACKCYTWSCWPVFLRCCLCFYMSKGQRHLVFFCGHKKLSFHPLLNTLSEDSYLIAFFFQSFSLPSGLKLCY